MSNAAIVGEGVRGVSPHEGMVLSTRGLINDLSREEVIFHVGKPVGSITGYVGPIFWQVWVEPRDAAGTVRARVEQGEVQQWQFDAAATREELLDQAKDRMIEEVGVARITRLAAAERELESLAA